jgi:hypothetical protein
MYGLKPVPFTMARFHLQAEQAAEKGPFPRRPPESHPVGAEVHSDYAAFAARLKSHPDTKPSGIPAGMSFSATCKARTLQDALVHFTRPAVSFTIPVFTNGTSAPRGSSQAWRLRRGRGGRRGRQSCGTCCPSWIRGWRRQGCTGCARPWRGRRSSFQYR